jgi:hypothetical protein
MRQISNLHRESIRKCAKSWESVPKPENVWESVPNLEKVNESMRMCINCSMVLLIVITIYMLYKF